jgi:hypothetical protein
MASRRKGRVQPQCYRPGDRASDWEPPMPNPVQIEMWARAIRREVAAGSMLARAAEEARTSFEGQLGRALDDQQLESFTAAYDIVEKELNRPIQTLTRASLRKARREQWYAPPQDGGHHWSALRSYMRERKEWSAETVDSIDLTSSEVVSLMEDPASPAFSGRGLVVGYVQSGKTANMLATIAKAVDAGYRFVIILAGMTNALRRQTQGRLNDDLLKRHPHDWIRYTTPDDDGDFQVPANRWFVVTEQAQIAVVKKNVTPLRRLLKTVRDTLHAHRDRLPVLIIDDECDQASVNSGGQFNITRINRQIRELLAELPRVQYVGYTATPFANVLINPKTQVGQMDDLYPQDFITALPRAPDYFGPERLFGRDPIDADSEDPEESGLDMIRHVFDQEAALLRPSSPAARFAFTPEMTPSLRRALIYFILSTACRYHRGDRDEHCSMLVHTTTYTQPHHRIAGVIEEWLCAFAADFASGRADARLERLWLSETARVDAARFGLTTPSYAEIRTHIADVLDDLEIAVENSDSESRLNFDEGPKKYIVVGGSVLARGLTIEGLSVSFFVRSSSQYDTLLQMGRWFGYRQGYEDLPRIWMTADLAESFRDLATVEAEIRADMAVYRETDQTPLDFAVRIRQIPGMAITAAKKMLFTEACDVSFSGAHVQTIRFPRENGDRLKENWKAGARLADAAAQSRTPQPGNGGRVIKDVPLAAVLQFLQDYRASQKDRFGHLETYIREEAAKPDQPFATWNIGIIEPPNAARGPALGAFGDVGLVRRARLKLKRPDGDADIKALMSRADVFLDMRSPPAIVGEWSVVKQARQSEIGDRTPLLLLYAIDRHSAPRGASKTRIPLDAEQHVLGVGIVLPDRGQRRSYVRVILEQEDAEEDILADLPDQGADQGDDA